MSEQPISEPNEGMKRQLSQAVAWNVVFTPIKFIAEIIASLIKVNLLTLAEVGTLNIVSATAGTAGIWLDLGIEQTLPKFIPEAEKSAGRGAARSFLNRIIQIKMLLLLIAVAALPLWGGVLLQQIRDGANEAAQTHGFASVAPLFEQLERYSWMFLVTIAALLILGALYDTLLAYLVSFFRQKAWNMINAVATLLLPLFTVVAVLLGWGIVGVLTGMIATALLSVLITWRHIQRISATHSNVAAATVPRELWQRFIPYTAMAFVISATDYFSSQYFGVLVTSFDSVVDVAVFGIAIMFIKQMQAYIYTPLKGIQVPLFTRIRAEGDHQLPRVWGTLVRLVVILVIPAGIGLALLLKNLLLIQFEAKALGSIGIGLLLIPFVFTEPLWGLGHNLLMVHEEYRPVVISRLCSLISIPLIIVLPPRLGLFGIVLALGISKLAAGLVVFIVAMRKYRLNLPWRFIGKVTLASSLMGLAIYGGAWLLGTVPLDTTITVRLAYFAGCVALTVLGAGLFIVLARWLKIISDEDRTLLNELRNPMARRLIKLL